MSWKAHGQNPSGLLLSFSKMNSCPSSKTVQMVYFSPVGDSGTSPLTHYRKAKSYSRLAEFHNKLSLQAGCYQNGTWAVGVAHCGEEEPGYVLMGQSMIVSPLGEVVAMSYANEDDIVDVVIDLDLCREIKEGVFNFELYRRPELYKLIVQ